MKKHTLFILTFILAATFAACDRNNPDYDVPEGALPGLFSVSDSRQVFFSCGNLRYHPASDIWQFAPSQYDVVGEGNCNIAPDYNGWIDLFGFGTGSFPTIATADNADYNVMVSDWGCNSIRGAGDAPDLWRTLSISEWEYLIWKRPCADSLNAGGIIINGADSIWGAILLPDSWRTPKALRDFKVGTSSLNTFTLKQWSRMEAAGAVFLPAGGVRIAPRNTLLGGLPSPWYWTSSEGDDSSAYSIDYVFSTTTIMLADHTFQTTYYNRFVGSNPNARYYGLSVRLVRDCK